MQQGDRVIVPVIVPSYRLAIALMVVLVIAIAWVIAIIPDQTHEEEDTP